MMIRRSTNEQAKRHLERADLASKVGQLFHRTSGMSHPCILTEQKLKKTATVSDAASQDLLRQAIHFAARELAEKRIQAVKIGNGRVDIINAIRGPRGDLIRSAAILLKASTPTVINQRVGSAPFEINLSFENGKFSVDSFHRKGQMFPVSRESMKRLASEPDYHKDGNTPEGVCELCGKEDSADAGVQWYGKAGGQREYCCKACATNLGLHPEDDSSREGKKKRLAIDDPSGEYPAEPEGEEDGMNFVTPHEDFDADFDVERHKNERGAQRSDHPLSPGFNRAPKKVPCKDCGEDFLPGEMTNGYCPCCVDKFEKGEKKKDVGDHEFRGSKKKKGQAQPFNPFNNTIEDVEGLGKVEKMYDEQVPKIHEEIARQLAAGNDTEEIIKKLLADFPEILDEGVARELVTDFINCDEGNEAELPSE